MANNNIGKKLFGIAVIGAAIGGAIAFFKKFENDLDDDFDDIDPFDDDQCQSCGSCSTSDTTRNYTTIAGERSESDDEETTTDEPTESSETE